MLHWRIKLATLALGAIVLASTAGGFFWDGFFW